MQLHNPDAASPGFDRTPAGRFQRSAYEPILARQEAAAKRSTQAAKQQENLRRNVLITGGIDDKTARTAVAQLLTLAEESDDPINVFISSPGGHVESGDGASQTRIRLQHRTGMHDQRRWHR